MILLHDIIESDNYEIDKNLADYIEVTDISGGMLVGYSANFAYDRKGWITLDKLGQPRNTSYGSKNDPIIIQSAWLLNNHTEAWKTLNGYHEAELHKAKLEKIAKAQAEVDAAQAKLDELLKS